MTNNRDLADLISRNPYSVSDSETYTSASISEQTISSFDKTVYRTCMAIISITSGSDYQTSNVKIVHDDTSAYLTESDVITSNGALASFTVEVSGNDIELKATPVNSSTTFNISRTLLKI